MIEFFYKSIYIVSIIIIILGIGLSIASLIFQKIKIKILEPINKFIKKFAKGFIATLFITVIYVLTFNVLIKNYIHPTKPNQKSGGIINTNKAINEKVFKINIMSEPTEAEIYYLNKFLGLTNRSIKLTKGEHEIILKKDGYKVYRDIVIIPQQSVLTATLKRE